MSSLKKLDMVTKKLENSLKLKDKNLNLEKLFVGLFVVYAVLVAPLLPLRAIEIMKHTWVRVVLIIVISLVCLVSPMNAMLMAIGFVVTLQRLQSLNTMYNNNLLNNNLLNNVNTLKQKNPNNLLTGVLSVDNTNVPLELNEAVEDNVNSNVEVTKSVANSLNNNAQELKNMLNNSPKEVNTLANNLAEEAQNVVILVNKEVNNNTTVENAKNVVKNANNLKNSVNNSNAPDNVKKRVDTLCNEAKTLMMLVVDNTARNGRVVIPVANANGANANGANANGANANGANVNTSLMANPIVSGLNNSNIANNMTANNLALNSNNKHNAVVDVNAVKALVAESCNAANNLVKECEETNNLNIASKNQIKNMSRNVNQHLNSVNNMIANNVLNGNVINNLANVNKKTNVLNNAVNSKSNELNLGLVNASNNLNEKVNNLNSVVNNSVNNLNMHLATKGVSNNINLSGIDGINNNLSSNTILPNNVDKLENNNLNNVSSNLNSNHNVNGVVSNNISNLPVNNSFKKLVDSKAYNINDLKNNMNVLTEGDNSLADMVRMNNRKSRNNSSITNVSVEKANGSAVNRNNNLLMNGVDGYKLENKNRLDGQYRNNISGYNKNDLGTKNPYLGLKNNAPKKRAKNEDFKVNPYNPNSLNVTNPLIKKDNNSKVRVGAQRFNNDFNAGAYNPQASTHRPFGQENFQGAKNNNVAACAGLPYSTDVQLRKAQDRRVLCNGEMNKKPVVAYPGIQSAQGYGEPSPVTGFNESGHESINYLCLGNRN